MKYFTPQLYMDFQTDVEAESATDQWEVNTKAYQDRLLELEGHMEIHDLSKLCLHDGLVVSRQEDYGLAIISTILNGEVITLVYYLAAQIIENARPDFWKLSPNDEEWLYDEVDLKGNGHFVHRIMFSTGVTLEIPFLAVVIHRFKLPK